MWLMTDTGVLVNLSLASRIRIRRSEDAPGLADVVAYLPNLRDAQYCDAKETVLPGHVPIILARGLKDADAQAVMDAIFAWLREGRRAADMWEAFGMEMEGDSDGGCGEWRCGRFGRNPPRPRPSLWPGSLAGLLRGA